MTRSPIGVAVVGAGYWGPNLVRNFSASPRTELRWVCDVSEERARSTATAWGSARATTSVEEVLADPLVDAVAVATPASTHAAIGLAALDAGKHVLIEKPLASSSADAAKLVDAARAQGLVLMCDHTYCYSSAVQQIRRWVRDGAVGRIRYFDSTRINLGLIQPDIDVFWDLGPHDLSILDFVLPADEGPTGVAAHAADPLGVGHPCVGFLSMPLQGGGIAHLNLNWLSPTKIRRTVIGGSQKMLVWDDLEPAYRLRMFDKGVDMGQAVPVEEDRRRLLVSYRTGDMVAPALPEVEALSNVVAEFADAVTEGRAPATDGEAGLRVVRILEAARESLDAGGVVVPLPG